MTNGKNKLPNARCTTESSTEEAEDGPEVRLDKRPREGRRRKRKMRKRLF